MSEMDDLKRETEASKVRATYAELQKYLDEVILEIEAAQKKYRVSSIIYLIAWALWVASSFAPEVLHTLATTLFIFALIYDQFRLARKIDAQAEFRGAMRILRILGYVPPRDEPGVKNKKKVLSQFREMVMDWATKKQKARDAVYQPV